MGIDIIVVWSFPLRWGECGEAKEWAATGAPPRGIHVIAFRFTQWLSFTICCSIIYPRLYSSEARLLPHDLPTCGEKIRERRTDSIGSQNSIHQSPDLLQRSYI